MVMTRHDEVDSPFGQNLDRFESVDQDRLGLEPGRWDQVMVSDHQFKGLRRRLCELAFQPSEPRKGESPLCECPTMSSVETEHEQLFVLPGRLVVGVEVTTVDTVGGKNSLPNAIQGNIVVTGNGDDRSRERVDKGSGLLKLPRFGPLGQVAGESDEVWPQALCQALDSKRSIGQVFRAEVNV